MPGPDKTKQKRKDRIHLIYYLLVFDAGTNLLAGHLVDINEEGIRLMCREPFAEGSTHAFRMILPDNMDAASRELSFTAQCAWCRNNFYSDFHGAGFRISDIDESHVTLIRRLITEFAY